MRDKYAFLPLPNTDVPPTHQALRDELVHRFGADKIERKQRSDAAEAVLRRDLATATGIGSTAVHLALHGYEQAHLLGGGDIAQLCGTLTTHYGTALRIEPIGGKSSLDCFVTVTGVGESKVGTIVVEEERFASIGFPGTTNEVFVRKGDAAQRHYVRLTTSNIHVKRYVTRGLSAFDAMDITAGNPLSSVRTTDTAESSEINAPGRTSNTGRTVAPIVHMHSVTLTTPLSIPEQIVTHTRGWGGNKRFISTGVSNRPALSTRGEPFVSMYGVVTVDLASVPLGDVYDVHRHDTASAWLGLPASDVLTNGPRTGVGDFAEQRYLALRDTIRTRELLIKRTIPLNALQQVSVGGLLLGIGSTGSAAHAEVQALIGSLGPLILAGIVKEDHMDFAGRNGERWHLVEFGTQTLRDQAAAGLSGIIGTRSLVVFDKFNQVRPVGMV